MVSKTLSRKLRVTGFCLLILCGFLILLNFLASVYVKPILQARLSMLVREGTGNLYILKRGDLSLNFLLGQIRLERVIIEPDNTVYQLLKKKGFAPKNRYHIQAKELFISFGLMHRGIPGAVVHLDQVNLIEPVISIENDSVPSRVPGSLQGAGERPPGNQKVRQILIDNLELKHGSITYMRSGRGNERFSCKSSQVDFYASQIVIDKSSFEQISAATILDKMNYTLTLRNVSFKKEPGAYAYKAAKVRIAKEDNEVRIDGLNMLPQFQVSALDLGPNQDPVHDFMTLRVDNIRLKIAAFFNTLQTGMMQIPYVMIDGADFRYNSDGIPGKVVKTYDMPQTFLKKLKTKLNIDSIDIHNGTIVYQDYNAAVHKNGRIVFNDINGMVTHLSNDSLEIKKHRNLDIAIRTKLYNKGALQLNVSFDMQSKRDSFRYSGVTGYFPLSIINQITVPLSSLEIVRGNAVNCWFDICADKQAATGAITGNYHNLYIKLLAEDTSSLASHKMKSLSSLANLFMVLNDNPLINEPVRTEAIYAIRDENRSFFRYVWRSLLSGLKPTIGMQKGREENFTAFIARFHHFSSWHRSGREARKIKRANRRQLRKLVRESHKVHSS